MRLLITGASGFIGGALTARAVAMPDFHVVVTARRNIPLPSDATLVLVDRIESFSEWDKVLEGIDVVIHAAAQAHSAVQADSHDLMSEPNALSTKILAESAARQSIRHFIYLSSAGVCGNVSKGRALEESDQVQPHSTYTHSKYVGEQIVKDVCSRSSMGFTCLRMPLVFGLHARGTFSKLLRFVQLASVTPFGLVNNRRSLLFVGNLVDYLLEDAVHQPPKNETFFIADDGFLSTRQIIDLIGEGGGKRMWHLPVPPLLFKAGLYAIGKGGIYQQLFGDFHLNTQKLSIASSWRPRYSSAEALRSIGCSLICKQEP